MLTDRKAGKVVAFEQRRGQETGRYPRTQLSGGEVHRFCELLVGTHFRMIAGKWRMIKLTDSTATLETGKQDLEIAHEFVGDECCVILDEVQHEVIPDDDRSPSGQGE